jgi:hypothetical protein
MQVELYIYLPNNFEVTADLTSITADSDIITADVTMLEDLYTAEKLDLFQDEKISVTQNLINYQDISKLFADYSQSFTIPASTHNNYVLKYWYDNALVDGFDARYRYDGFIEVDKVRFKIGTFQLDSVTIKERKPENYKVTFFGKVKQLKDIFGDAKLSILDYSSLNHPYNATEVYNRIAATSTSNVRYPLFAHDRLYDFGGGGANDVTTNAGAINWSSLFPTISVPKIFDFIEAKYGITFSSIFFDNYAQFKKLHLLLKNAEVMTAQAVPLKINFTSKDTGFNALDLTNDDCNFGPQTWVYTGTVPLSYTGPLPPTFTTVPNSASLQVITSSIANYRINYYKDAVLIGASNIFNGTQVVGLNPLLGSGRYSFEMVSDAPITFTTILRVGYVYTYTNNTTPTTWSTFIQDYSAVSTSQTTVSDINIQNYIPDIKLYDFFMGIVKMFNLVIVPTSETNFLIEPMELWYSIGKENDITENIIEESIDITPPKIFKEITFNYEKSENILNNAFRELFTNIRGFDYGDLRFISDTDVTDSKYEVKLPFENVMFERDNGSTLQTTTFKDKNLNNYLPKPVLIYDNGFTTSQNSAGTNTNIKYYNGSTYQNITTYRRFSNELTNTPGLVPVLPGNLLATCWNNEQSSWFVNNVMNGLYQNHYSLWVSNLYDVRTRVVNCKAYFNPYEISNISLNDRIIIKDQRYVINNITTDLTTGESSLELLTDFRPDVTVFSSGSIGFRMSNYQNLVVPKDAMDMDIVAFIDQFEQFDYLASTNGLLSYILKTGVTDNDAFNVTMPANTTGVDRYDNVVLKYYLNGEIYYYFIFITQVG